MEADIRHFYDRIKTIKKTLKTNKKKLTTELVETFDHVNNIGKFLRKNKSMTLHPTIEKDLMSFSDKIESLLEQAFSETKKLNEDALNTIREYNKSLRGVVSLLENGHKLLLIGGPQTGKTTFLNNLKLLFLGVSDTERKEQVRAIRRDMIAVAAEVVRQAKSVSTFPNALERASQKITLLDQFEGYSPKQFEHEQIDFKMVFSDVMIRKAVENSALKIPANASYMMNNFDRIIRKDFVPNNADILSCHDDSRPREHSFQVEGFRYKALDFGADKRRYATELDTVSVVFFFVALDGYNLSLEEDSTVNKMKEAIRQFHEFLKNVEDIPVVLVLNRQDLFSQKLKKIPLNNVFPNYTGGENYVSAIEFIKSKFLDIEEKGTGVTVWVTNCLKTDEISENFMQLHNTIKNRKSAFSSSKRIVLVSYKDEKKKYHIPPLASFDQIVEDVARLFLDSEQLKAKKSEGIFKLRRFDSQLKDFIDVNNTNEVNDKAQIKLIFGRKRNSKHPTEKPTKEEETPVKDVIHTSGGFLAPPVPPTSPTLRGSGETAVLRVIVEYDDSKKKVPVFAKNAEDLITDVVKLFIPSESVARQMKSEGHFKLVFFDKESSDYIDLDDLQDLDPRPKVKLLYRKETDISLKNVKVLNLLGAGNFGEVYRGLWNETIDVALKTPKGGDFSEFRREISVMSQLSHPNIVRWFGMYKDMNTEYMVMEYVSGGNLKDLLESKRDLLSFSELMDMIISAATGMEYLENKKVIHRDLAARNLLVKLGSDNRYEVKVSDFGLARQSEYYRGTSTVTLPIRWSSPELLSGRGASSKSDSYSFGVVMWEILEFGLRPYHECDTNEQVKYEILKGNHLRKPEMAPELVYALMQECWRMQPEKRPNFTELLNSLIDIAKQYRDPVATVYSVTPAAEYALPENVNK